ncbi:38235_t:CDS:1, partial [Gigaspora margarita]
MVWVIPEIVDPKLKNILAIWLIENQLANLYMKNLIENHLANS